MSSTARPSFLIGVLLIFAVGAFTRLWNLGSYEFWIDEYGTWWVASVSWADTWQRAMHIQGQSPLYYLSARAGMLAVGDPELGCRLPSILAGLASVALVPFVARRVLGDERLALIAGVVFALNQVMIFQTQNARPYALGIFCALLSFHFFVGRLQRGRRSDTVGWVAATAAMWYVHYLLGMAVAVQLAYLLIAARLGRVDLRSWLRPGLVLGAIAAPGLLHFLSLFGRRGQLDWFPTDDRTFPELDMAAAFLQAPALAIATVVAVLSMAGRATLPKDGVRTGLLAAWLFVPFGLVAIARWVFGVNLTFPRYLALAVPAAAMAAALLLGIGQGGLVRRVAPTVVYVGLVAAWSLTPALQRHGTFCKRFDERWRGAVADLAAGVQPGDSVLYRSGFVESDRILAADADPLLRSFVEAPVRASWPATKPLQLVPIPFKQTPETTAYLNQVLQNAARSRRVWLIGFGALLDRVIDAARQQPGTELTERERQGVRLVLVTRR